MKKPLVFVAVKQSHRPHICSIFSYISLTDHHQPIYKGKIKEFWKEQYLFPVTKDQMQETHVRFQDLTSTNKYGTKKTH